MVTWRPPSRGGLWGRSLPLSDQSQPQIKGTWGSTLWKVVPLMAPQTVGLHNAAHKPLRNTVFCPRMEVRKLRKISLFQKRGKSEASDEQGELSVLASFRG